MSKKNLIRNMPKFFEVFMVVIGIPNMFANSNLAFFQQPLAFRMTIDTRRHCCAGPAI